MTGIRSVTRPVLGVNEDYVMTQGLIRIYVLERVVEPTGHGRVNAPVYIAPSILFSVFFAIVVIVNFAHKGLDVH